MNSRWASKRFYRLKLVYLIFLQKNFKTIYLTNCSFIKKKILKNSKWPQNSIWQIFCTKIHDFLVAEMFD
jgi:hypothetical protein